MKKKRKVTVCEINHCYQRTVDRGVLFYNIRDHLVFFTVFCTMADRYDIRVVKLVQMPDHVHHSSMTASAYRLSCFQRDYTSIFARECNSAFGLHGPVFDSPFGSAPKHGNKAIRTNMLYIDNNPVERKLVARAEQYQWNYIAYAQSENPFSQTIRLRYASAQLRRALKLVRGLHDSGQYITYRVMTKLFDSLPSIQEKDQLADYIVNTYSVIDHSFSIGLFGSFENEILAAASNTGSEYDIQESFVGKDDRWYSRFSSIVMNHCLVKDIHDILRMDNDKKEKLFQLLRRETGAPGIQIAAYLHLPVILKH